jgi:hypothetical protein
VPLEVSGAQQYKLIPTPPGWSLDSAYRNVLSVSFVDPSGNTNTTAPPANFVTLHGALSRGLETLEIEVTQPTSPELRTYAALLLDDGSAQKVPLGVGFANGPTFLIDTGSSLIRGTYDDGATIDTFTVDQQMTRLDQLQATARSLLTQVTGFDVPSLGFSFTSFPLTPGYIHFDPPLDNGYVATGTFSGAWFSTAAIAHSTGKAETASMSTWWDGTWEARSCIDPFKMFGVLRAQSSAGLAFSCNTTVQIRPMDTSRTTGTLSIDGVPGSIPLVVELVGGTCDAVTSIRVSADFDLPAGFVY